MGSTLVCGHLTPYDQLQQSNQWMKRFVPYASSALKDTRRKLIPVKASLIAVLPQTTDLDYLLRARVRHQVLTAPRCLEAFTCTGCTTGMHTYWLFCGTC